MLQEVKILCCVLVDYSNQSPDGMNGGSKNQTKSY